MASKTSRSSYRRKKGKKTFDTKGFDEVISAFTALGNDMTDISTKMVYTGIGILADEIRHTINAIPPELINEDYQRVGLKEGLGVSKIEHRRNITSAAVGFGGYNNYRAGKFKSKGQANVLVARIITSGTKKRKGKNDFTEYARRNTETKIINAMQDMLDEEVERITKG